jgi:hypothetical protein
VIPSGPTPPAIEQQRLHRAVTADDAILKFFK